MAKISRTRGKNTELPVDEEGAYLGVDPGASGGIAMVRIGQAEAWGIKGLTERDLSDLFEHIKRVYAPEVATIEKAWAMPKQGVASSFKFGLNYGFLRGMLCAHRFRFTEITSHKWQRKLECLTKGDKNVSKRRAQQLFPELKITHATADALLIAEYGRRTSQ